MKTCPLGDDPFQRHLVGDPIDVVSGAQIDQTRDFVIAGALPVEWWRGYDSRWHRDDRGLGRGFRHAFDHWLIFDLDGVLYRHARGWETAFPHLTRDGEIARAGGYTLERVDARRYRLHRHAEPTRIFERAGAGGRRAARLSALVSRVGEGTIELGLYYERERLEALRLPGDELLDVVWTDDGHIASVEHVTASGARAVMVRYAYEGASLVKGTDAYGHSFTLGYDEAGRLSRRTDRAGYSVHWEYDARGRCVRNAGEDGLLDTQLRYDPLAYETEVRRADGGVWRYQYLDTGVVTFIRDPYGGERYFEIGEDGRLLAEHDEKGARTEYRFDAAGAPIARVDVDGRVHPLPERARAAGARLPIELERGLVAHDLRLPDPVELAPALPSAVRAALVATDDPRRGRARTIADRQGRRLRERLHDGQVRQYTYGPGGGLCGVVDMNGGRWELEHASGDLLVAEVDPRGRTTRYEHTPTGALAAVVDPAGVRTELVRDLADRVVEVRRGGAVRDRYAYDVTGRLVEKRDAHGELLLRMKYDRAGRVKERALASGEVHTFRYDEAARVVSARVAGDHEQTFRYDSLGRRVLDAREGVGVERVYAGLELFEVRALSRFVTQVRDVGAGMRVVIDPAGGTHRLRAHGGGVFTRDLACGWSETTQYDPRGGRALAKILHREGERDGWARRYRYSAEGDLLEVIDSERGVTRYEHDASHRLTRALHPDGREDRYAYNLAGALYEAPSLGKASIDDANRLRWAQGERFEHDARHHLAVRRGPAGTVRYERDARDQLVRVVVEGDPGWRWEARYDALGRRIAKTTTAGTTWFFWDGDRLAAERHEDGRVRVYVYDADHALVPFVFLDYAPGAAPADATRYYVLTDQRGAVVRVLDDAGETAWSAQLEPFGLAHVEVGAELHQPLRLAGHYHDAETGLHYNRFRYYAPALGRYLESDPLGVAGGPNVYAYTRNPLVQTDAYGLCADDHPPPDGAPTGSARPDAEGDTASSAIPRERTPASATEREVALFRLGAAMQLKEGQRVFVDGEWRNIECVIGAERGSPVAITYDKRVGHTRVESDLVPIDAKFIEQNFTTLPTSQIRPTENGLSAPRVERAAQSLDEPLVIQRVEENGTTAYYAMNGHHRLRAAADRGVPAMFARFTDEGAEGGVEHRLASPRNAAHPVPTSAADLTIDPDRDDLWAPDR